MSRITPATKRRALRTIMACSLIREHASEIADVAAGAHDDDIIVTIVDSTLQLTGIWKLERSQMVFQIPQLEVPGGWSLIFSPQASAAEIAKRCTALALSAFQRWRLMEQITE